GGRGAPVPGWAVRRPAVSLRHQNRLGCVGMEVVEKFVLSRIEGAEHDECSALRGEHLLAVKLDALELGGRVAGIVELDLERAAGRHPEAQRRGRPLLEIDTENRDVLRVAISRGPPEWRRGGPKQHATQ